MRHFPLNLKNIKWFDVIFSLSILLIIMNDLFVEYWGLSQSIQLWLIVALSRLRSSLAFFAMLRFLAFDHHSSRTIKELVSGLVSTTVLLCTIILASSFFTSALILWAKLKNRSSQKRAVFAENLVAPPHHGFFLSKYSSVSSKFAANPQKDILLSYLNTGRVINHHFCLYVCMLLRVRCVVFNNPIVLVVCLYQHYVDLRGLTWRSSSH